MNLRQLVSTMMLAATPACMGTYRVSPQEYVPQAHPAQIVVVDHGGSVYVLDDPAIVGDKLTGVESGTPDTVSVPVNQLEDGMVRHKSKGKTVALVGGLAAGAGLALYAVTAQGHGSPCVTGKNKTDQGGGAAGGNSQCDLTLPDGVN